MPALIDIRRRIRSVKSTQQITKAMKMISAAKLRRAQEAIFAARPYARLMGRVLNSMASRADPDSHPLLRRQGDQNILLVVITADKGLCGAFNASIIRSASNFLQERKDRELQVGLIGRKGRDFFRRRHYEVHSEHVGIFRALEYATAQRIAGPLIEDFSAARFDEIHLVYNEFKSVIQQRVIVERLLPIERHELQPTEPAMDYLYEPEPAQIFSEILPKHVEIQVYRAVLESAAAEHGARMTAMDAATNNAAEMIDRLTLYMNKVRQAAITREIIEVVSGTGSSP
jgi:F-type H+-transporting ATPase subunit gamma